MVSALIINKIRMRILSFLKLKSIIIFVLMMYEEDNIAYQFQNEKEDNFLDMLLEQKQQDKAQCPNQHERQFQNASINQLNLPEQEYNHQFSLSLQEKEQLNFLLPQKPFQQQGEEDMMLIKLQNKRAEQQINHVIKKECKIDKLAYQQQTRAIKLRRYRDKKARRKWDRKVFYDCRKIVADNRERINGRFVKKSPFVRPIQSIHKNSLATGEIQIPKQLCQSSKFFQVEQIFLL